MSPRETIQVRDCDHIDPDRLYSASLAPGGSVYCFADSKIGLHVLRLHPVRNLRVFLYSLNFAGAVPGILTPRYFIDFSEAGDEAREFGAFMGRFPRASDLLRCLARCPWQVCESSGLYDCFRTPRGVLFGKEDVLEAKIWSPFRRNIPLQIIPETWTVPLVQRVLDCGQYDFVCERLGPKQWVECDPKRLSYDITNAEIQKMRWTVQEREIDSCREVFLFRGTDIPGSSSPVCYWISPDFIGSF